MKWIAACALALVSLPAAAQPACDRACLETMVDRYMAALVKHDSKGLPFADDVRFAENNQPLKIGQGSWRTIDGQGTYKHYMADPHAGQIGFIGTVREFGVPAFIDLRLQVKDGKIVEVESFVIRDAGAYTRYEALGAPEPVWLEAVPVEQRLSREVLAETVNKYFQSMSHNDGKGDYSFFHPDCNRLEHGLKTTNMRDDSAYGHSTDTSFASMTCEAQFKTGFLGFVTGMRDRRFTVIDEERQVVFASVSVDHDGTVRKILQSTGKVFVIPDYFDVPRTLQVQEAFKIRDGKLFRIEMTLIESPYGQARPYPAAEAAAAATPGTAQAEDALKALADQTVQGMLAGDISRLPLAEGFRYTENGVPLDPGEGMWRTVTAYAGQDAKLAPAAEALKYRFDVVDAAKGEIVAFRAIDENGTRGLLILRLKVKDGKIAEMEAIPIRHEYADPRGGTVTLLLARHPQMFDPALLGTADSLFGEAAAGERDALIAVANAYFDGQVAASSKKIPFDPVCARRHNGHAATGAADSEPIDPAAPAYKPWALGCAAQVDSGYYRFIEGVRDRRFHVDAARGLIVAIGAMDTPGTLHGIDVKGVGKVAYPGPKAGQTSSDPSQQFNDFIKANLRVPSSALAVHLFKIRDGRIVRIESFSRPAPYGARTGW